MLRLADQFDRSGDEMRARARLGEDILRDEAVSASAELSKRRTPRRRTDIRAATTGKHGLLTRGIELDADALMVRTTVLTYRWIDELQDAAYKTLGSIAGRAIGYLAPEIALGGAVVSAGLIETDALDRDGVAAYLSELAENNPELMDHVTSGGGGLLDGLQMRSVLTAGVMAGETGPLAAQGGLRAMGLQPLAHRLRVGSPRRRRRLRGPAAGRAPGRGRRHDRAAQHRGADDHARRRPRPASTYAGSPTGATSPTCPAPAATAAGCGSSAATTRRTPARWCARSRRPSRATTVRA